MCLHRLPHGQAHRSSEALRAAIGGGPLFHRQGNGIETGSGRAEMKIRAEVQVEVSLAIILFGE